ncbi:hypothetical protein [Kocuria rosea]|uniref:hypothetical protein n=1 Tax=Kocuria rosea TaxID=1275 RepID=UPI001C93131F|nr:hypothetical protein [Kocuria rosea]
MSEALAVVLHPHTDTEWIATYYPLAQTTAGRKAEITHELHHHLLPAPPPNHGPARWLEAHTADPEDTCYADFPGWRTQLAAGYALSLTRYHPESIDEAGSDDAAEPRDGMVVIPVAQLSEWILTEPPPPRVGSG